MPANSNNSFLNSLSRRNFIAGASAFAAFNMAFWSGGCEGCLNRIKNRPTRRNIANLSANDPVVTTYKAAVAAMKALPSSNPISWVAQANIHNNKCPHGCWFFLPWHRAYLLYFERICRKVTGDNSFALPYWNWTTSPAIPSHFWGGSANPLFDGTRGVTSADTADPSWVGAPVIENILSNPSFTLFGSSKPPGGLPTHTGSGFGILEGNPHNNIHGWIGGDMGNFMSPLDPIFWMHHNMLDCLWVDWNINLNNANTNDSTWTDFQLTDFVDENGSPVSLPVIETVLFPIFTYQFEPCSPNEAPKKSLSNADLEKFLRAGAPSTLTFGPPRELGRGITAPIGKPVQISTPIEGPDLQNLIGSENKSRLILTLEGVDIPAPSDFFVRVFVDKSDASGSTSIDDPHFAGSFGVFGDAKAMPGMTGENNSQFFVDITTTTRKLNQAGSLTAGSFNITLVAVPYTHHERHNQALTIQRVLLATAKLAQ
jgi:tyrosinase